MNMLTNLSTIFKIFLLCAFTLIIACDDKEEEDSCDNFALSVSGSGTQITLDITEGATPYNYDITYTGGATQSGTTTSASTTITAEAYEGAEIVVTDASSCSASDTLEEGELFDPCEDLVVTVTGSETQITLDITEGTAPYSYEITYAGGTVQSDTTSSASTTIIAEVYEGATIVITDASSCTASDTLEEGELFDPCEDLTVTVAGEKALITLTVSEGAEPFNYVITYAGGLVQEGVTSDEVTVIEAEVYEGAEIAVTDVSSCTETMTLDEGLLSDPCTDFSFEVIGDETDIVFAIEEGTEPFDYVITYSGGSTQSGDIEDRSAEITADVYEAATIVLTDAFGCTATANLEDPCVNFSFSVSGDETEIVFAIESGLAPFDYEITYTGGSTQSGTTSDRGESIEAEMYGAVTVVLTDALGCITTATADLEDPCVDFSFDVSGEGTGIVFAIEEGTVPFNYVITYAGEGTQSGSLTDRGESIEAEIYEAATVVLTDALGCTATADLEDPCVGFSLDVSGDETEIVFAIESGVAPFSYEITYTGGGTQSGTTSDRSESIEAEVYEAATVVLTDALGCTTTASLEDEELDPCVGFTVSAIGSDGEITMTIAEGLAPYDYVITYDGSSVTTEGTITESDTETMITAAENVTATITVTDANGCEAVAEVSAMDLTSLLDTRDGQRYGIVTIGTQVWLSENFNYDDGTGACYDDDDDNCMEYGKLYTWDAAMEEGFAPDGWRLPTRPETETLNDFLGEVAGLKLKVGGSSGFKAKFGGEKITEEYVAIFGEYSSLTETGQFWTSTHDDDEALTMLVTTNSDDITLFSSGILKDFGISVRFIKEVE